MEESIERCEMSLHEVKELMTSGDLLPPSLQTCFSALEWLRTNNRL